MVIKRFLMLRLYYNLRKIVIILDDEHDIPNLNLLLRETEGLIKISYRTLYIITVSTHYQCYNATDMHSHCLALSNPVTRILITCTYYRPTPSGGKGCICFCVTSCNSLSFAAAKH